MRSVLYEPVKRLFESPYGLVLAFAWGFLEATVWPVIPDFLVFGAIVAVPRRWWLVALATVTGSLVGGTSGYSWAFSRGDTFPLDYVPLVTEKMISQAGAWLAQDGVALGLLRQPMSGIPYKVFVYLSGAGRLSFPAFIWASALARGGRIFLVATVAALLGALAGDQRRQRFFDLFLALYTTLFAYGLWKVVQSYS